MALVGYARVSTRGQNDDSQVDDLKKAGCERIFVDKGVTGKLASRPELDACLDYMRAGDVLVVTRMSRAMRSLKHMLELVSFLDERGMGLRVLKQEIDTTTSTGRLVFHIMAAIDEFQRELIVEGTREGLDAARARGRRGGRKKALSETQARIAEEMYNATGDDGKRRYTVDQIASELKCSRPTIYRYLNERREAGTAEKAKP